MTVESFRHDTSLDEKMYGMCGFKIDDDGTRPGPGCSNADLYNKGCSELGGGDLTDSPGVAMRHAPSTKKVAY
eukprot:1178964-Prorocentrum_minimum.AAC.1